MLSDPREQELPDVGIVELEDAETGERVLVDTSDAAVRALYSERAATARQQRERLFRRNGVDAIEIGTGSSYIEPLMGFFRARTGGVRRRAAG